MDITKSAFVLALFLTLQTVCAEDRSLHSYDLGEDIDTANDIATGLATWVYIVIGIGVLIVLAIIVSIIACCVCCARSASRTPAPVHVFHNQPGPFVTGVSAQQTTTPDGTHTNYNVNGQNFNMQPSNGYHKY